MHTKRLSLAAAVVVLASCAHQPRHPPMSPMSTSCGDNVCHVRVTVENCAYTVDPPRLEVLKGAPRVIKWSLPPASPYDFASDGIHFKQATSEFDSPSPQGKHFTWRDKNTTPGEYAYNVRVQRGAVACPVFDPSIVNLP